MGRSYFPALTLFVVAASCRGQHDKPNSSGAVIPETWLASTHTRVNLIWVARAEDCVPCALPHQLIRHVMKNDSGRVSLIVVQVGEQGDTAGVRKNLNALRLSGQIVSDPGGAKAIGENALLPLMLVADGKRLISTPSGPKYTDEQLRIAIANALARPNADQALRR